MAAISKRWGALFMVAALAFFGLAGWSAWTERQARREAAVAAKASADTQAQILKLLEGLQDQQTALLTERANARDAARQEQLRTLNRRIRQLERYIKNQGLEPPPATGGTGDTNGGTDPVPKPSPRPSPRPTESPPPPPPPPPPECDGVEVPDDVPIIDDCVDSAARRVP